MKIAVVSYVDYCTDLFLSKTIKVKDNITWKDAAIQFIKSCQTTSNENTIKWIQEQFKDECTATNSLVHSGKAIKVTFIDKSMLND